MKARILERQHIIVDGAESTVRPMLHAFVERIDDAALKIRAARMSRDNGVSLLVREPPTCCQEF